MFAIIIKYWYLFVLVFIAGFLLNKTKVGVKCFINKASLVKRYWFFIIPFILVSITLYYIILNYSPVEKINIYASILGQILTLIFAIFVGYFAFLQVVEGRLDKLEERAYFELKQRSYRRATQYYEEAYIINPKDSSVLSNLLELYLILEDYNNFDEKINQLQRISIEEKEKVALLYLQVAEFLLKQHLHEAKEEIKKLVQFIEKHPMALNHFNWNFSDIQDSEVYKRINGESKTIFDNLIKYVSRKLSNEQKNNFEKGNYSTPVEKS